MIKKLNILILTMFGLGNSKYAPGTVASFVTCLVYIWFYNSHINLTLLLFIVSIIFIYSVYSIDNFQNNFSQLDAKEIVIDEYIGQSIPILTIYNLIEKNNLNHFIFFTFVSFLLFRIFDIFKPYPINKIDEKMKNGLGIILDDVIAGVYSVIALLIIMFLVSYV